MSNIKKKKYQELPFYELEILDGADKFSEELFNKLYYKEFNKAFNNLPKGYEEEIFKEIFESKLKLVKKIFPQHILNTIPDIRILAFGKIGKKNYNDIDKILQENNDDYAYLKEYKKIKEKLPIDVEKRLHLHDCLIKNIIKEENELIVDLDCSQGIGDIKRILFKDYEIKKEKINYIGKFWLDEKIYIKENGKFELQILINNNKQRYFIIQARDIIVI